MAHSSVQNPAWDFEWLVYDYPLDEPVGFWGRLSYIPVISPEAVMERYFAWREQLDIVHTMDLEGTDIGVNP